MNVKIKTSAVIIVTLLMGILLGTLISRTMMRNQFERKIHGVRNQHGFLMLLERIIEPEEEQYEEIKDLLNKRSRQLHEVGEKSRKEIEAIMNSLRTDIEPILTKEQKERLEYRMERFRKWGKRRPPFGKPGRGMRDRPHAPPPPPPEDEW